MTKIDSNWSKHKIHNIKVKEIWKRIDEGDEFDESVKKSLNIIAKLKSFNEWNK